MDSVQKEVRALEALDHANIVKFVSSFQGSNDGFPVSGLDPSSNVLNPV